jgi:hypothetical protein
MNSSLQPTVNVLLRVILKFSTKLGVLGYLLLEIQSETAHPGGIEFLGL